MLTNRGGYGRSTDSLNLLLAHAIARRPRRSQRELIAPLGKCSPAKGPTQSWLGLCFVTSRRPAAPKKEKSDVNAFCEMHIPVFLARELKKHVRGPRWPAGCDAGDW